MTERKLVRRLCCWTLAALMSMAAGGLARAAETPHGEQVFNQVCIGCHLLGVLGAPKSGDKVAWAERLRLGMDTLVQHALNGFNKMPAKGGNPNLTALDLRAAITFMAGEDTVAEAPNLKVDNAPLVATALTAAGAQGTVTPPATLGAKADNARHGEEIVKRACRGCHEIGVLGAPKIGNAKDWEPRLKKGEDALVQNATKGIGNMPPKGGRPDLTADDLRAAIRHMSKPVESQAPRAVAAVATPTPSAPAGSAVAETAALRSNVNRFNRLMRPVSERNPSPVEDGIHDPDNDGTQVLQSPRTAFDALPRSKAGNYVDWVKALQQNAIDPRWDVADPTKEPLVMDLNIVREVKGSMPNVVYPHKQHLQWLECSNCHPGIFQPQKGANQISMAEILLGRKCGVCHGTVAFPVTECRRCHSMKKENVARK